MDVTADKPGWSRIPKGAWIGLIAAPGVLALMVEPAAWLVTTWTDPTWDSSGALAALACLALIVRSLRSGPAAPEPRSLKLAVGLVAATAVVRLAGRVLAVNALGALALCFDVAALGLALGIDRRSWAVKPAWLAVLFAFSLPVEQILQRVAGFPLRLASAAAAHGLLSPFVEGIERQGTLLTTDGMRLAIDLPCSGAQGLMLLGALSAVVLCRRRVSAGGLVALVLAAVGGALVANTARILMLFVGLRVGLGVMAEPWHSILGLFALAAGCLPLLLLARRLPARIPRAPVDRPPRPPRSRRSLVAAFGFTVIALAVAAAPAHPLDVAPVSAGAALPAHLGDRLGSALPPSQQERAYYARYGGHLEKRAYTDPDGPTHTVLLARTTAPLRHLHGPDRCLLGAGHRVERLGVRPTEPPSTVFKSVAPDGGAWRVEAWFLGPAGESAASVPEVTWRWLRAPGTAWTLIERITPWELCQRDPQRCTAFDESLLTVLDHFPEPREDSP